VKRAMETGLGCAAPIYMLALVAFIGSIYTYTAIFGVLLRASLFLLTEQLLRVQIFF
jgi:hypothetical protein